MRTSREAPKSLEDWRQTIKRERRSVNKKPYSHNIISIALGAIRQTWGDVEANQAIDDFKLHLLGWSKKP